MSKYIFLLSFMVISARNILCQPLSAIPDLTYWNTSYKCHFPNEKRDTSHGIGSKPMFLDDSTHIPIIPLAEKISTVNKLLSEAIKTKKLSGCDLKVIDTNLVNSLMSLQVQFSKSSFVTLDYYNENDNNFKSALTYLYNASISSDTAYQERLLGDTSFSKVPCTSIQKSIVYIYGSMIECNMTDRHFFDEQGFLERVDSASHDLLFKSTPNTLSLVNWDECMGDAWSYFGWTAQSYLHYTDARTRIAFIQNDSVYNMLNKRLESKLSHITYGSKDMDYFFKCYPLLHTNWNSGYDIYHHDYTNELVLILENHNVSFDDSFPLNNILDEFTNEFNGKITPLGFDNILHTG